MTNRHRAGAPLAGASVTAYAAEGTAERQERPGTYSIEVLDAEGQVLSAARASVAAGATGRVRID